MHRGESVSGRPCKLGECVLHKDPSVRASIVVSVKSLKVLRTLSQLISLLVMKLHKFCWVKLVNPCEI